MKTITLPTNNRLEYLEQTIESLKQFDLSDYTLFVNIETGFMNPGKISNDTINTKKYLESQDFVKMNIQIHHRQLGVQQNPFNCIERAFIAGSEWNIHIEDDLIFAPDAFELADWYYNNQKDNVIIYGLCNRSVFKKSGIDTIITKNYFDGLGWCISKDTWLNHIRNHWFDISPYGPHKEEGWDCNITRYLNNNNLLEAIPETSRTNTIGEWGTYARPNNYKQFKDLIMSTEIINNFKYKD